MSALIYLIRHATPDWSRTDLRYDIPPGPPLTPYGEAEAQQLGEFLKTVGTTGIYASPMERAFRTAQIAAAVLGIVVTTDTEIVEWEHGELEADVLARCRARVDAILDESTTRGPLALITHGGPVRLLLTDLGLDPAEIDYYRRLFDRDNPLPPAGVWRISRLADGTIAKPELIFTPQPYTRYTPSTVHV